MRVLRYSLLNWFLETRGSPFGMRACANYSRAHRAGDRARLTKARLSNGDCQACVLMHPPVERARLDQEKLPARDNLHERLHESLEMGDAHAERRRGVSSCEESSWHRLDRTIP